MMLHPKARLTITVVLIILLPACNPDTGSDPGLTGNGWKQVLEQDLQLLGHRNWVLVVDKAFPEQSSTGMKYIYADEELLPILEYVLDRVEKSTHVRPVIYRDKELSYITEDQVPGIGAFRSELESILEGRTVQTLLHDEVFAMLDRSSSLFRILVIKSSGTIPYTSVFMQLDCSYWGPEQEKELRVTMEGAEK